MFSFEIKESSAVENSEKDLDGRFLQSPFWASFKAMHGWTVKRFVISASAEDGMKLEGSVSVLLRTFRLGFINFSLAYIPLAPEFSELTETKDGCATEKIGEYSSFLIEFEKAIKEFLPKNLLCVRFDLPVDFANCEDRDFYVDALKALAFGNYLPIKKTITDIQPPDTTILDLTKTEEELLAGMKSKWRYNVHLAEKKGVEIKFYDFNSADFEGAMDVFYSLYETTAKRDGIAIHAKSYYSDLLKLSATSKNAPVVRLYIASHENDALAAIITLFSRREAVYLYGCSSNVKRNLMPAYLLQWTAIQDAKAYGASIYDFYGMPPTDDEHHPMYGLYRFKTGFGGPEIHRPGSVDVPASPLYPLYAFAEQARAFYHKRIKKFLAGR